MLSLPRRCRDAVVDHAERGGSAEVCGILGGRFGSDRSVVESVHPADNAADSPATRYAIDSEQQLELMDRIREAGSEVVGFYHSHPAGPAEPSATDAALAAWPDRSYVIVGVRGDPSVTSWRFNATTGAFEAEELTVRSEQ